MTTILVTGGAGFIGSNLADRLLAEDHRVIAVDDLSTGRIANLGDARTYGKAYTFFNMDVRAGGLLSLFERHRPEIVFHLAAQAGVRPSLDAPVNDAGINIMGTLNVLECAVKVEARKVIYAASGGTIYGEPKRLPAKESTAQGSYPLSPYGISKKAVLDYLGFYQRYRGLDFTACALANVYGPRQDPFGEAGVVSIFASSMLAGKVPTMAVAPTVARPSAGDGSRLGQAREHRHGPGDERHRALRAARADHRVRGGGHPRSAAAG